ncbi:hypothetical protein BJX65DRAFT_61676 [Aspergillus insuetus]
MRKFLSITPDILSLRSKSRIQSLLSADVPRYGVVRLKIPAETKIVLYCYAILILGQRCKSQDLIVCSIVTQL